MSEDLPKKLTERQIYQREYYKRKKKKIQSEAANYYQNNKEEINIKQKSYNKDYYKFKTVNKKNKVVNNKPISNTVTFN